MPDWLFTACMVAFLVGVPTLAVVFAVRWYAIEHGGRMPWDSRTRDWTRWR